MQKTELFRRSKHNQLIVSPNHIILLTSLLQQGVDGFKSKTHWYGASLRIANKLRWYRTARQFRHAEHSLPDCSVTFTRDGNAISCKLRGPAARAFRAFLDGDEDIRFVPCGLGSQKHSANEHNVRERLRALIPR